jgi:hypothetical protein
LLRGTAFGYFQMSCAGRHSRVFMFGRGAGAGGTVDGWREFLIAHRLNMLGLAETQICVVVARLRRRERPSHRYAIFPEDRGCAHTSVCPPRHGVGCARLSLAFVPAHVVCADHRADRRSIGTRNLIKSRRRLINRSLCVCPLSRLVHISQCDRDSLNHLLLVHRPPPTAKLRIRTCSACLLHTPSAARSGAAPP